MNSNSSDWRLSKHVKAEGKSVIKTLKLIVLVCAMQHALCLNLNAQTVDVTGEFKQVLKELAKEEFRTYVFNSLKEKDPIIAASTYDLIQRVASGDTAQIISNQVIISLIDYSMFIKIESEMKIRIPNISVVDDDGKVVDSQTYERLSKIGVLLAYEKIARDNYLIVGDGIRKMLSEETEFVSSHFARTSSRRNKYGFEVYLFMNNNEQMLDSLLASKQMLKNIMSIALKPDTSVLNDLKPEFERLSRKKFASSQDMLREALGQLRVSVDAIYNAYEPLKSTEFGNLFRDMAPYVYNIAYQRVEHLPLDYTKETAKAILDKLSSINSEHKIGFNYRVGLWIGLFFDGKAWNPPTSNKYILSLRLNDRIQYTFTSSATIQGFVYIGGFVDVALKEISGKTANEFVFGGLGSSYQSISWTISGFVPIDAQGTRGGIVFTTMYDLPIEKIIQVF